MFFYISLPEVLYSNITSLTTSLQTHSGNQISSMTTDSNAQNHVNNQIQGHHIGPSDSMNSQPSALNVVKLTPASSQDVAKTMIDLPGHVQQLQMPNDDMLLIVPSEMDGLLSGMNIVSDGK